MVPIQINKPSVGPDTESLLTVNWLPSSLINQPRRHGIQVEMIATAHTAQYYIYDDSKLLAPVVYFADPF